MKLVVDPIVLAACLMFSETLMRSCEELNTPIAVAVAPVRACFDDASMLDVVVSARTPEERSAALQAFKVEAIRAIADDAVLSGDVIQ